ncbi:MAG: formylglycine-generating enzyme family protein [Magnetospirillum sp.]|nr:formylglycine-generating enzyme family protein [Magnetospirillum sp.]
MLAASAGLAAEPASFRDCPDCPEMVRLPGGRVRPGDGEGGAPVAVEPFAIGRTEITVRQWRACVAAGACRDRQVRWADDDMPRTDVTAREAEDYAAWLSRRTGKRYRLPSEAEWEYAAKAGTATPFPWGEAMEAGRAVCQRCDPRFSHQPAPVATMAPNPFGLYDMNGNLWEWTRDCWEGDCSRRAMRGGSWYFVPWQSRSASRAPQDARTWSYDVGFRVVRAP